MTFSVCIPAFRADTVAAAIASILGQTWTDWELFVVGQGNDAGVRMVAEAAARQDRRVRYLHLEQRGTCRARNAAMRAASGELIAMIDDDCEAHADWLAIMAEYFVAQPDVGLVGGALVRPRAVRAGIEVCPAMVPAEALYDPIATPRKPPAGWDWIGCSFGIRRSVAEQAGFFDEHLGPGTDFPAGEDTDYKLRLEALGIKMISTPRAVVYHTHGYRYGLQALMRHVRNYAYGNGGVAGKLTLMGDPRGREWLLRTWRECLHNRLQLLRPQYVPIGLVRALHFTTAYYLCLHKYRVETGMLYPLDRSTSISVA